MCGRVRLSSDYSEIKIVLRLPAQLHIPNFGANWNGAPTQSFPIALLDRETGVRRLDMARWGLLPHWAKDLKQSYATFNARSEAIETKPAFRDAWKRGRRCLVPVDNFYEWKTLGPKEKQPYAIGHRDRRLMTLAGLWSDWRSPEGETIRSYTIITTTPNPMMAELHTRMPVVLGEAAWPKWLGEEAAGASEIAALLAPYAGDDLIAWPVDKRVGNVRNNDASLMEPVALQGNAGTIKP